MKFFWLFALSLFLCSPVLQAQELQIPSIPSDLDAFLELRDDLAQTPQGGAAIFVTAMLMYEQDKELGLQAFTIALDRNLLSKNQSGYKGFVPKRSFQSNLRSYFAPRSYIGRSYVKGTSPEKGYTLPDAPYRMQLSTNIHSEQSDGSMRVFIKSSGADSPRPVTLKQNNRGLWKVTNYSSLFMGMRRPALDIDDDL